MASEDEGEQIWVWDNINLEPGLSGFRGPFSRNTIAKEDQVYPHPLSSTTGKGYNILYRDGHVRYYTPGITDHDTNVQGNW